MYWRRHRQDQPCPVVTGPFDRTEEQPTQALLDDVTVMGHHQRPAIAGEHQPEDHRRVRGVQVQQVGLGIADHARQVGAVVELRKTAARRTRTTSTGPSCSTRVARPRSWSMQITRTEQPILACA